MLTVEHVKLRRKAGVVGVVPLCGLPRERALALAGVIVDVTRAHDGEPRAVLEEALDSATAELDSASEARFGRGLRKLALDACDFDVDTGLDPADLRAEVFAAAALARRTSSFDRLAILASVAAAHGVTSEEVERALFADLSAAHAVRGFALQDASEMIDRYQVAELQAVLLRATQLTVAVDGSPAELRALLRALKLHQLLFEVEAGDDDVKITVEGPMALFQQSTRYGLKLALLLPAIRACRRHRLTATVRLRKHGALEQLVIEGSRAADQASDPVALPEVTAALLTELTAAGGPWRPSVAVELLKLPGAGALVPDLKLENAESGEVVFVEILGFWSRTAVWKRVELVEKGLPWRVVFCASQRLRVSEAALPDDAGGALVVYKGVLRAARVLEAVARVTR